MSPDEGYVFVYPPELVRFLTSKAGMRSGFKLLEFLMLWGKLSEELGREPTRLEFCERWDEGEGTYWRRLALWRGVWPEDSSPERVWQWVKAEQKSRGLRVLPQ